MAAGNHAGNLFVPGIHASNSSSRHASNSPSRHASNSPSRHASPESVSSTSFSYYDERLSVGSASDSISHNLSNMSLRWDDYDDGCHVCTSSNYDHFSGHEDIGSVSVSGEGGDSDDVVERLIVDSPSKFSEDRSHLSDSKEYYSCDEASVPLRENLCPNEDCEEEEVLPPKNKKKKKHITLKIEQQDEAQIPKHPSFLIMDDDSPINSKKFAGNSSLLRGPRRVIRLCVFALLIPLGLVVVPLYIRVVRYPPQTLAMAPSDQRLLGSRVSSVWCQGQRVHMNGSFNAYLLAQTPETKPSRSRFTILKNLKLRDDIKEYWGFYLRGGSTVTLSSCTRYDGGQLMILRGSENLHRCAWIGEEDSFEETQVKMPSQTDFNNLKVDNDVSSDEYEKEADKKIGSRTFTAAKEKIAIETIPKTELEADDESENHITESVEKYIGYTAEKTDIHIGNSLDELAELAGGTTVSTSSTEKPLKKENVEVDNASAKRFKFNGTTTKKFIYENSEERQEYLNHLLKHALEVSKGKHEVILMLDSHTSGPVRDERENNASTDNGNTQAKNFEEFQALKIISSNISANKLDEERNVLLSRERRNSLPEDIVNNIENDGDASEVMDEEDAPKKAFKKFTKEEIGVEQIIGGLIIPDGLTYERGFMNQSHANDMSMEEERSSYSSSEEALASCDGVILALPLQPDSHCSGFERQERNKVTYQITEDGTYYFVFSSDNEIVINDLFFNLTLEKVVYDTSGNLANCSHSQNCSLHLDFWSNEQTVVEVPAGSSWDNSYVMNAECEPRVAVYLCLLLLVPIFILFCAYH
ncbi:uncharacterized protein LOC108668980 [Hyalella azteca]|uniref:Uncharacterized protein LOC108668980 n=1 Tax=Hyalella azteca TaxID=294128 RepID=A0A8B7NDS7_HYAAZ|nr:uncharacterized protein LOC108668980 [Hyalella azteca]